MGFPFAVVWSCMCSVVLVIVFNYMSILKKVFSYIKQNCGTDIKIRKKSEGEKVRRKTGDVAGIGWWVVTFFSQ